MKLIIIPLAFFSFTMFAFAESINHHSCELWIPKWEIHASGDAGQRNKLKRILSEKNYQRINITIRGPSNTADHLLLSMHSDAWDQGTDEGMANAHYYIHNYVTNLEIKLRKTTECQFKLDQGHYWVEYDKKCTNAMIELAKSLPSCKIH